MSRRVLGTILVGRDLLSPVLADAGRNVEQYGRRVEASNVAEVRSASAAAGVVSAAHVLTQESARRTAEMHGAQGQRAGDLWGQGLVTSLNRSDARGKLATEAERIAAGMEVPFQHGGERNGGIVARGIHMELVRNSPLIAAAVGGALVAGAPVAIAGAQAVEVRTAWSPCGRAATTVSRYTRRWGASPSTLRNRARTPVVASCARLR